MELKEKQLQMASMFSSEVNDELKFGDYYWYVIDKTSDSITLLCKEIVVQMPYNDTDEDVTWEECSLRQWLNTEFYNGFSESENALIAETQVKNKDNSKYNTKGGNDTNDKIFLLSVDEIEGIDKKILKSNDWWWLRSPGKTQNSAMNINSEGEVGNFGNLINYKRGVRPVLILKTKE